jgi:hypothetical protein
MRITATTLQEIEDDEKAFMAFFNAYVCDALAQARLYPRLAKPRVVEIWGAWRRDMQRVGEHERQLHNGLDHFKRAGHLAFWIRRFTPVVELVDLTESIADAEGYPPTDAEIKFRKLLTGYLNEYLAFDLGYLLCSFHEQAKEGGSERARKLVLDDDYYRQICHSLKFKTVSPHALAATYKSLFITTS